MTIVGIRINCDGVKAHVIAKLVQRVAWVAVPQMRPLPTKLVQPGVLLERLSDRQRSSLGILPARRPLCAAVSLLSKCENE